MKLFKDHILEAFKPQDGEDPFVVDCEVWENRKTFLPFLYTKKGYGNPPTKETKKFTKRRQPQVIPDDEPEALSSPPPKRTKAASSAPSSRQLRRRK